MSLDLYELSYDTETNGVRHFHRMFAFSVFSHKAKDGSVMRLDGDRMQQRRGKSELRKMWSNPNFVPIMHRAKFDMAMTAKEIGDELVFERPNGFHDTSIQSMLYQSWHRTHALKDLLWGMCGYPKDDQYAIKKYMKAEGTDFSGVPESLMRTYQLNDAERTMLLYQRLKKEVSLRADWQDCYEMEMDLIYPTIRMERRGVMIDVHKTNEMIDWTQGERDKVTNELAMEFDMPMLNLNARRQVAKIVYEHLGLPIIKETEVEQEPSTAKAVLAELQQSLTEGEYRWEMLEKIAKYTSYKTAGGFLKGYLKLVDDDGILHPDIKPNGAWTTGRESCAKPNLQNVNRAGVLLNKYPVNNRLCFIPKPGFFNVHIDYAQIELRLLIHFSGDENLIKLQCDGADIHTEAAKRFFGESYVNSLDPKSLQFKTIRSGSKNANFAIPYGGGMSKITQILGLSKADGAKAFNNYRRDFEGLVTLNERTSAQALEKGFINTAFGRRLYVPDESTYVALNYKIQGSAAHMLKMAQIRVDHYLRSKTNDECGLILPVHDEIVCEFTEYYRTYMGEIMREIRELMIDFGDTFRVPMDVEAEISNENWGSLEELPIAA